MPVESGHEDHRIRCLELRRTALSVVGGWIAIEIPVFPMAVGDCGPLGLQHCDGGNK